MDDLNYKIAKLYENIDNYNDDKLDKIIYELRDARASITEAINMVELKKAFREIDRKRDDR